MEGLDAAALRNSGVLSLSTNPETIAHPAVDPVRIAVPCVDAHSPCVQALHAIAMHGRIYDWIIWTYLAMPGELANAAALDILRIALSDGWITTVFRNEVIYPHTEFDFWFSNFKTASFKLSNHKKVLTYAPSTIQLLTGLFVMAGVGMLKLTS